jgi:hypothetical protein
MILHPILAPIELTDAELDAVSGGHNRGASQNIRQSAEASLHGGNVATFGAGIVAVVEPLVAVIVQVGNNIAVNPSVTV